MIRGILILLATICAGCLTAAENIALGKPYTWNRAPNYALCSKDPGRKQLTDGSRVSEADLKARKLFWTLPEVVGWNVNPPIITIDLGSDMPISGASFSTAAGHGAVEFPRNLFVMVSTDNVNFYLAADLAEELEIKQHTVHEFRVEGLSTHGRYVRFIPCTGDSRFVFIDELEVYGGAPELLSVPYTGRAYTGDAVPLAEMINTGIRGRLKNDIGALRKILVNAKIPAKIRTEITAELNEIEQQVKNVKTELAPDQFRAVIPVHPLEEKVLALYAGILRAEGFAELEIWQSYRHDALDIFQKPEQKITGIELKLLQGEHRAEVINLTNAGSGPLSVQFSLDLPGTEVRQVEYVDTVSNRVDASALCPVRLENGVYTVEIPSGMTKQLWLTFCQDKAGTVNGSINLKTDAFIGAIPVKLNVGKERLPKDLQAGLWDYAVSLRNGITAVNRDQAIADMRGRGINIAFATREVAALPAPEDVESSGKLKRQPDFSAFEKWLGIWPEAEHYQVFLGLNASSTFAGLKPGTAAFDTAVKEWTAAWNAFAKKRDLKRHQIQFHFIDEPRSPADFAALAKWLVPFREAGDMIAAYNNPVRLELPGNFEAAREPLALCDVICPMTREYVNYKPEIREYFQELAGRGKEIYFYSCDGPSWFYHSAYFRLQPWYSFKFEARGSLMWVYSDGANNWNDYIRRSMSSYSMVYLSPDSTTSSKRWEAFREGLEDYGYLTLLKNRADARKFADEIWSTGFFEKGKDNFSADTANLCRKADELRSKIFDILNGE